MKTNQLMKRDFMGDVVTQRTKDSFLNATDLLSIYNSVSDGKKRFADFWENKNVSAFIKELENDIILNVPNSPHLKTYETSRGRGGATWMHPYLFVKFAMWLSPKFELNVIKWVYDNLIEYRQSAGNHYKEMCEVISRVYYENSKEKPSPLVYSNEAKFLNSLVYGSSKGGKRNELSEKELQLLNDLQKLNIKFLLMGDNDRKQKLHDYSQNFKIING